MWSKYLSPFSKNFYENENENENENVMLVIKQW